jgi:hypothetical protein
LLNHFSVFFGSKLAKMRRQVVAGFLIFITFTSAFNPLTFHAKPKLLDFVQSDFMHQVVSLMKSNGADKCSTCKNLVSTMKLSLANPRMRMEATQVASQVCRMVDASSQQMCSSFVASKLPSILDSIAKNANAESICEETFNVCKSSSHANPLILKSSVTLPPAEINDIECAACCWLSVFVLYGLCNKDTGHALSYEVAKFCTNYIGDPTKQKTCFDDANQIGELLPLIPTIITPSKICKSAKLNVCSPSAWCGPN